MLGCHVEGGPAGCGVTVPGHHVCPVWSSQSPTAPATLGSGFPSCPTSSALWVVGVSPGTGRRGRRPIRQ